MPTPKLTDDQLAALTRFARVRGHYWRAQLRTMWERSHFWGGVSDDDAVLLREVRNAIGPSGLAKVQLAAVDATAYLKAHKAEVARLDDLYEERAFAQRAVNEYNRTHSRDGALVLCPTCPRGSTRGAGRVRCGTCHGQGAVGSDYCRPCPARCDDGSVVCPTCAGEGLVAGKSFVEEEMVALLSRLNAAAEALKTDLRPGTPRRGDVVIVARKCKLPLGTLGALLALKTWDQGGTSAGILLPTGEVVWVDANCVEVALAVSQEERDDIAAAFQKNAEEYAARRRAQGGR